MVYGWASTISHEPSTIRQPMPYRLKKWFNRQLNRLEFRLRRPVLSSFPTLAYVEPTNICTLRCALCPSGQRKLSPLGKMPLSVFQQVLDVLGPYLRQVHLYNWGEPLLHEELPEMVAYAKRFGCEAWVSTNLAVVKDGMARRLVKAGLDCLNVSIDGASQATYESYRAGGKFDEVVENLRLFVREREATGSRLPEIRWQFLVTKKNEAELDAARKMAESIGVRFHAKRLRVNMASFLAESATDAAASHQEWLPENQQFNRYSPEKIRRKVARGCKHLWDRVVINWDGSVSPCCQIYEPKYYFAPKFEGDFRAIWNGPPYVAARRLFGRGGSELTAKGPEVVCKKCIEMGTLA
ncbi:MAG: radical SAM protein [Planctomycetes bacterium]|nr:radical SAM protein [Planctomycetota bacterium]